MEKTGRLSIARAQKYIKMIRKAIFDALRYLIWNFTANHFEGRNTNCRLIESFREDSTVSFFEIFCTVLHFWTL